MVDHFSLSHLKGLIAFPSYHATLAVILVLVARGLPRLFWPLAVFNLVVLVSATVDGGHHLADIAGGVAVGIVSVVAADRLRAFVARELRPLSLRSVKAPVEASFSETA